VHQHPRAIVDPLARQRRRVVLQPPSRKDIMMGITIGNYTFDGPFSSTVSLQSCSGVYAILGRNGTGGWAVVDIGESGDLRNRIDGHDREACWNRETSSSWSVAAYYCDEPTRMRVESALRSQYNPPCGKR
jgi:hypothetical protein